MLLLLVGVWCRFWQWESLWSLLCGVLPLRGGIHWRCPVIGLYCVWECLVCGLCENEIMWKNMYYVCHRVRVLEPFRGNLLCNFWHIIRPRRIRSPSVVQLINSSVHQFIGGSIHFLFMFISNDIQLSLPHSDDSFGCFILFQTSTFQKPHKLSDPLFFFVAFRIFDLDQCWCLTSNHITSYRPIQYPHMYFSNV